MGMKVNNLPFIGRVSEKTIKNFEKPLTGLVGFGVSGFSPFICN
jgi:hypothetical protein